MAHIFVSLITERSEVNCKFSTSVGEQVVTGRLCVTGQIGVTGRLVLAGR